MSVKVKVSGITETIKDLNLYSDKIKDRLRLAFDSVLIEIVNWIKNNHQDLGGWKDRTGNLNNSITASVSGWDGEILKGQVSAGEDYAIYVELREGHWVISGGMREYEGKIMGLIGKRMA
jgi:hypothetical protein